MDSFLSQLQSQAISKETFDSLIQQIKLFREKVESWKEKTKKKSKDIKRNVDNPLKKESLELISKLLTTLNKLDRYFKKAYGTLLQAEDRKESDKKEIHDKCREMLFEILKTAEELRLYSSDFIEEHPLTKEELQAKELKLFQQRIEKAETSHLRNILLIMGKEPSMRVQILQHLDVSQKISEKKTKLLTAHKRGNSTGFKDLTELIGTNTSLNLNSHISDRQFQGWAHVKPGNKRAKTRYVVVSGNDILVYKKDELVEPKYKIPLLGSFVRLDKKSRFTLFSRDSSVFTFECEKERDFIMLSSTVSRLSQESTLNAINTEDSSPVKERTEKTSPRERGSTSPRGNSSPRGSLGQPSHNNNNNNNNNSVSLSSATPSGGSFLIGRDRRVSLFDVREAISFLKTEGGNTHCADCGAPDPEWISINLGIFVCLECSGGHRHLGTDLSQIRSAKYDNISQTQLQLLIETGNTQANLFWEADLAENAKPTPTSSLDEKTQFIKKKYQNREFVNQDHIKDIRSILHVEGNDSCVFCRAPSEWTSIGHAIFVCAQCATGLNSLGFQVRAISAPYEQENLRILANRGNSRFDLITPQLKQELPKPNSSAEAKTHFIQKVFTKDEDKKEEKKKFAHKKGNSVDHKNLFGFLLNKDEEPKKNPNLHSSSKN